MKTVKIELEYLVPEDAPTDEVFSVALRAVRGHEIYMDVWPQFVRASLVEER